MSKGLYMDHFVVKRWLDDEKQQAVISAQVDVFTLTHRYPLPNGNFMAEDQFLEFMEHLHDEYGDYGSIERDYFEVS